MTENESNQLKDLCSKCSKRTQDAISNELSVRSMIMSCLIYGQEYLFYDSRNEKWGKYGIEYTAHYNLDEKEVLKMFYEQKEEFEKGELKCCVHTDGEGCTYNSFKYQDELKKEEEMKKNALSHDDAESQINDLKLKMVNGMIEALEERGYTDKKATFHVFDKPYGYQGVDYQYGVLCIVTDEGELKNALYVSADDLLECYRSILHLVPKGVC